jgi:hypothetical protein
VTCPSAQEDLNRLNNKFQIKNTYILRRQKSFIIKIKPPQTTKEMKKFKAEEYHPTKRARKMTKEKKMKLKMLRFQSQSLPVESKMKTVLILLVTHIMI